MSIDLIILVTACVINILLGSIVFFRNPKSLPNILFSLLSLSATFWVVSNYITNTVNSSLDINSLFNRIAWEFAFLSVLFGTLFTYKFPASRAIKKIELISISFISLIVLILSATPLIAGKVELKNNKLIFTTGPLLWLFVLGSVTLIVILIRNLLKNYKKQSPETKSQTKMVLFGFVLSVTLIFISNLIIPALSSNWQSTRFGPIATVILVASMSYAIIKHKLFDIKLIVARSVAYALTLAIIGLIYGFLAFSILGKLLFKNHTISFSEQLVDTLLAVVLVFTFQPLKKFFDKTTNKLFYRDAYDSQAFLDEFIKTIVTNYELHPLLNNSIKVIEKNIKPTFTVFGIKETDGRPQTMVGSQERIKFAEEDIKFVRRITPHMDRKIIVVDDLENKYKDLQDILIKSDVAVVARIATQYDKEGLGYLILGPKKSGNQYSSQDLNVIEILANELVIAIQNSLRFEEIQSFNATLQQKVNEATYKLRRANERLKVLDETKDDFISMASHQLRTPLTSIKGYLSMILEGDAGKVNSTQHDMLGQAFFSSQRMVYLIADMLNVSRLKTGKFAIESSKVNLANLVEQEMQQLKDTALAHDVNLTYDKPKDFPDLMMDETKIRQVVMNFADNAIYYTPKNGHIEVDLKNNRSTIELTIKDDGIGVPNSEKHHLFTKFYRAGNARKVRPDGTGLGLYMAKKVIMAQGGSIIFESEEGKGSKFGFIFPKDKLAFTKLNQEKTDHASSLLSK